jgi:CobQ-like glutamine amidotransferase family enzyme
MSDPLSIALVYPDLLGTYGDGGNAVILAQRSRWRGTPADVVEVHAGTPLPVGCDIYVLGGGEDAPQALAADQLSLDRPLHRAVDRGAVVFAVCAGLQVIGESFLIAGGKVRPGLGLVDCRTGRTTSKRAVGELVVEPDTALGLGLPTLSGYENHGGVTDLGPSARRLGRAVAGVGNGDGHGSEGIVAGRILGTYMHGPALARNPALADLLLAWALGLSAGGELPPLDDAEPEALRAERLRRAGAGAAATHRGVMAGKGWRRLGR